MGIGGDNRAIVFYVTGEPATALQTANNALAAEGFKIIPVDQWTFRATRGSKAVAFLLGAIAPFVEARLLARSSPDDPSTTIIEMDQIAPGCLFAGGLIGAKRSKAHIDHARNQLANAFTNAGVLRGLQER